MGDQGRYDVVERRPKLDAELLTALRRQLIRKSVHAEVSVLLENLLDALLVHRSSNLDGVGIRTA